MTQRKAIFLYLFTDEDVSEFKKYPKDSDMESVSYMKSQNGLFKSN